MYKCLRNIKNQIRGQVKVDIFDFDLKKYDVGRLSIMMFMRVFTTHAYEDSDLEILEFSARSKSKCHTAYASADLEIQLIQPYHRDGV